MDYSVGIYAVEPQGAWPIVAILLITFAACALLIGLWGRRAWWLAIASVVILPSLAILPFGGSFPRTIWPLHEYVLEIVAPLALIGLPGALIGIGIGSLIRWRMIASKALDGQAPIVTFRREMKEIGLSKVEIDVQGRLRLYPEAEDFAYIYRAGMEVGWDPANRFLFSPPPREWSYADWFGQITRAAASEYGVRLQATPQTDWTNIPPDVQAAFKASVAPAVADAPARR